MKREWILETVVHAKLIAPFTLDLIFSDGKQTRVNLRSRLRGPVFKPLRDPEYFALVLTCVNQRNDEQGSAAGQRPWSTRTGWGSGSAWR